MAKLNDEDLTKEEDRLVEQIKEWLWDTPEITDHIRNRIKQYWTDDYGINLDGPLTNLEEEFICQCQVQLMQRLLAKVIVT